MFNKKKFISLSLADFEKLAEMASLIQQPCQVYSRISHFDKGLPEGVESNKSFWSLFPLHGRASFKREITNCLHDPYTVIFKNSA